LVAIGDTIPWGLLDPSTIALPLLIEMRTHWAYRVTTELRSVQVMTRFMGDVVAAGDPLEVYAGAADAIADELRHTALCVGVVERLGVVVELPEPLDERAPDEFLALPAAQRALATAVSMLAISETISFALIEDLRSRCTHPTLRAVLERTLADEDAHHYGWAYVKASLARFDGSADDYAREVAAVTLEPHLAELRAFRAALPADQRVLSGWPEPERAHLGILGRERQALVKQHAIEQVLLPRLDALGIAP